VKSSPERDHVVPPAVRATAEWSWRIVVIAAAGALICAGIVVLKSLVAAVAVALLLAVLLMPVTDWVAARSGGRRTLGAFAGLATLVAIVSALLGLAGRQIVKGIPQLWEQSKQGIEQLTNWLSEGPLQLDAAQLQEWLDRATQFASENSEGILGGALKASMTIGQVFAGTLIALFALFFFLKEPLTIWNWIVGLFPRTARKRVFEAGRRGAQSLSSYTHTQVLVALVDAIGIAAVAYFLKVSLWLPLGVLVFLGSFIPIVGAVVTGAIASLVALVEHGPQAMLIMLIGVLVVQQVESHVLQPFLMGHAVSLHPLAVLLAVAAGSMVAGILGALFAVPVAAVTNTVVRYLNSPEAADVPDASEDAPDSGA
jgi:predicted PurR-regulated permease PerM